MNYLLVNINIDQNVNSYIEKLTVFHEKNR